MKKPAKISGGQQGIGILTFYRTWLGTGRTRVSKSPKRKS
jgi:hypothetical protein